MGSKSAEAIVTGTGEREKWPAPAREVAYDPGTVVPREWRENERARHRLERLRRRDRLSVARMVINGCALFGIVVTAICIPVIFEFSSSSKIVGLDGREYSMDWQLMLGLLMFPTIVFVGGLVVLRPTLKWWAKR